MALRALSTDSEEAPMIPGTPRGTDETLKPPRPTLGYTPPRPEPEIRQPEMSEPPRRLVPDTRDDIVVSRPGDD
jgi:hypothetical protein